MEIAMKLRSLEAEIQFVFFLKHTKHRRELLTSFGAECETAAWVGAVERMDQSSQERCVTTITQPSQHHNQHFHPCPPRRPCPTSPLLVSVLVLVIATTAIKVISCNKKITAVTEVTRYDTYCRGGSGPWTRPFATAFFRGLTKVNQV